MTEFDAHRIPSVFLGGVPLNDGFLGTVFGVVAELGSPLGLVFWAEHRPGQFLTCAAGTKRFDLRWREAALFPARARAVKKQIYLGPQR